MIELLIALFLKFWMFLFGTIRGAISAVPFLRRLMLSNNLESEFSANSLTLRAEKRDLLLSSLRIFAIEGARIVTIGDQEILLCAGEARQIALPDDTRACVLMTQLVDLKSGRRVRIHRRLEPTKKSDPGNALST